MQISYFRDGRKPCRSLGTSDEIEAFLDDQSLLAVGKKSN